MRGKSHQTKNVFPCFKTRRSPSGCQQWDSSQRWSPWSIPARETQFAVFPWTWKSIFLGVAQLWLVSCRIVFRFGAGCERIETTCFSLSLSPLVTAVKLALAPGSPWWSTMPRATGDGGLNNWYERSLIKHLAFQGSRHCSSTARAGSPSPPIGHLED